MNKVLVPGFLRDSKFAEFRVSTASYATGSMKLPKQLSDDASSKKMLMIYHVN